MIKFVTITVKLIGLIICLLSIAHAFGIYKFPTAGLGKPLELLISFFIGVGLIIVPTSTIEKLLVKKAEKEL